MARLTRDAMIKATAPDCARFIGYGGGNALVYNWHRIEIRFPARRNQVDAYERDHGGGCVVMAEWDIDTLIEYAELMGFRCTDIERRDATGYAEELRRTHIVEADGSPVRYDKGDA